MQIGRVVFINYGPEQGRLAVIVDVLDNKRGIVVGPSTGVAKQQIPFTRLLLTEFVLNVHRNEKTKKVQEEFDKEEILKKWNESTHGQRTAKKLRRATLTDFERF